MAKKKNPIYDGNPNDGNGTKQLPCYYKIIDHYELEHYEVKGNKKLINYGYMLIK
jgi:hypothetical protein